MVRIQPARGEDTRVENRVPGADTDPYIALAVTLAAGFDGIREQIEPASPIANADAYAAPADVLPRTLGEALRHLEQDEWARRVFGDVFIQHYLKLRNAEYDRFLRYVTDWERNEYQDLF